ncbi:protein NLP4, partial [Tanacetum coccineum]
TLFIQPWLPVRKGGECVLTTEDQPFILNSNKKGLLGYRDISKSQHFATEDNSEAFFGLPSLVFLKKFPMCTSGGKEDANNDQQLNLCGFLDLPIFEVGSGTCLGVIEIVTISQNFNYRHELNNIRKALEAVDLRVSEFLIHPKPEHYNGSYELVLTEIREVLRSVCDTHSLPLAQTWSLCAKQGRGGCHQESTACISVISCASYVFDPNVLGFFELSSELHLLRGEGIVGKALGTNQPCFAADITGFSTMEYPLSDHAKRFRLSGAVAIRLRSTYTVITDFILEFFLPRGCRNNDEQKHMLSSISYVLQNVSKSLHVIDGDELVEEYSCSVKETGESSWISYMMAGQQKSECFAVAMTLRKEEPQDLRVLNQCDHEPSTLSGSGKKIQQDLKPKGKKQSLGMRKSVEKKRTRAPKNISLPVLQQHFSGKLKDAAKSIGVCPTTLKKICRGHGIMLWPSRKIKKVGHSSGKLQLIIDSVQGAKGSIQLASFYANFPELSSTLKRTNDSANLFTSQKTTYDSSSCGSHSSGSSTLCCSKVDTLYAQKPSGLLNTLAQDEGNLLVLKKEEVFRVKVVYGEKRIRIRMSRDCDFGELQREIMVRFNIDDMTSITLKYLDDDSEWILLTSDADLEECMDINAPSKKCRIQLFLKQSIHLESRSSYTGNCSS